MSPPAIRVGVLLAGGDTLHEWTRLAVCELAAIPLARLFVVLLPAATSAGLASALLHAYDRFDARVFPASVSARRGANLSTLLPVASVHAATDRTEATRLLAEESRRAAFDVIVDLTDAPSLPAGVSATLGVWGLSHDGTSALAAARAAVLEGRPTVRSVLHTLGPSPVVLYESVTGTDHVSSNRAADRLLWKCVPFAARALRARLHTRVEPSREPPPAPLTWDRTTAPDSLRVLSRVPGHALRYLRLRLSERRHPLVWVLLTGRREGLAAIRDVRRLSPQPGTFWADPFICERDGRTFVFFEEYSFASRKGHISVLTMDAEGHASDAQVVLARPYHLSYPFIFEHAGELFMLPETAANRTIELYRCVAFPNQWTPHATVMRDVHAVDSTLVEHDGRWWMFTNVAPYAGSSNYDELFIFHAESPLSERWIPHTKNPVVSHVGFARPAGALFREHGHLIRPSQDCAGEYGRAIRLNRVEVLTPDDYREVHLSTIEPDWDRDIVATHSFSCNERLVMLDGKQRGVTPSTSAGDTAPPRVTIHPVAFQPTREGALDA